MSRFVRSPQLLVSCLLAATAACSNTQAPGWSPGATFVISGFVTGGTDPTQVTVTLSPGGVTVHPRSDGEYRFEGLADGNYTVSPSLSEYAFEPPSLSVTVDGMDLSSTNFAMRSLAATGPNTPDIPLPKSATDELPGKSKEFVTDVVPLKDFSPYVDSEAFRTICPNFVNGNVVLVSKGAGVTPTISYSYTCRCHDCNCNWFGFDCDTCCDKCPGTCSGPLVVTPPYLRRTVYWQKLFQALVGPGASYSQTLSVTSGSAETDAQTMAATLSIGADESASLFGLLSKSLSETLSQPGSHTQSVTITGPQSVPQTFSCPTSADNHSRLFAVWQLHERFDFSNETGTVVWTDSVYHPAPEANPLALDNALSHYFESTTAF